MREGEPGSSLYIIRRGRVDVVARGQGPHDVKVAELSTMDYFGELALLHDAPRNATVVARGTVEVYRLDGAEFQSLLRQVETLRSELTKAGSARQVELNSHLLGGY